jgi:hypothetical protein
VKSWSRNAVPKICATAPSAAQAKKAAPASGSGVFVAAKTAIA